MKTYRVIITYRSWVDFYDATETYISYKASCEDAIADGLSRFKREHLGSQNDIVNILAKEEIL